VTKSAPGEARILDLSHLDNTAESNSKVVCTKRVSG
jgi:hypothetical protein